MFHKKVVQEITPQLIVRYVLPKREIVKIMVAVVVTEMVLHHPVRSTWAKKVETKVDSWLDSEPGSSNR